VGEARANVNIGFIAYGESRSFKIKRICTQKDIAGYGTDDWGHLFPPLGFLLYSSYMLLEHLELTISIKRFLPYCFKRAYAYYKYTVFHKKADKLSQNYMMVRRDQIIFMVIGFFLMMILSGDIKKVAHGEFPKHLIFGVFVFLSGFLGLLLSTSVLREKSFPFVTPLVYIYLGMFFLWHEQYTYYAYFMHTVFGYLLFVVGFLSGVKIVYPQLTMLFLLVAHFAAFVFIGTDNGLVVYLQPKIPPMHFVMFLLNAVFIYLVVVVGLAYLLLKRRNRLANKGHVRLSDLTNGTPTTDAIEIDNENENDIDKRTHKY